MRSILGNGTLLKKTYVPKYIFPLAKVTSSLVDCFFSSGSHAHRYRVHPSKDQLVSSSVSDHPGSDLYLQSGSRLFLSAINVFFRDMQHIYQAVITAWMYATPLFYDLDSIKIQRLSY